MSTIRCRDVHLNVEEAGDGTPLVLIHGAWADLSNWDPVVPQLAQRFRVIRYDRRGYGGSQRPGGSLCVHVEDLLNLVHTLGIGRAILVGNSFGGLVAIHAALAASECVELVVAHEPPMLGLLASTVEQNPIVVRALSALNRALAALRAGDHQLAAKSYVDGLASSPGTWQYLPDEVKVGFIRGAPAFLEEGETLIESTRQPLNLESVSDSIVISHGERTNPFIKLVTDQIYKTHPEVRSYSFPLGGHVPHQSCPHDFVKRTIELVDSARGRG